MIYFVRHGQTDDNANGKLTGWSATPLNEKGFAQAKETAENLKDIKMVRKKWILAREIECLYLTVCLMVIIPKVKQV